MATNNYIEILAKSSSGSSYTVGVSIEENSVSVFCSCPAGINRKLCKHIKRVMAGDDDSILYDRDQINMLMELNLRLQKTEIPFLIKELKESEILLEKAQKRAKKAKSAFEKVVLIK
ncbi:MAG: SWIM zinc finger family protein [Phycisphaerae bacterium]|jgi:uncharacterized Zn finger protein